MTFGRTEISNPNMFFNPSFYCALIYTAGSETADDRW